MVCEDQAKKHKSQLRVEKNRSSINTAVGVDVTKIFKSKGCHSVTLSPFMELKRNNKCCFLKNRKVFPTIFSSYHVINRSSKNSRHPDFLTQLFAQARPAPN